jgi:hypothetical protein
MKKPSVAVRLAAAVLFVLVAGTAAADTKSVTIPKGTKVEKLGPGSFKLTTPDGTVFAITSYKKPGKPTTPPGATAIIGDCGILGDCGIRDSKGKIIATGANGVLKGKPATAQEVKGVPPADYIKIDDEVTWLPAVIEFPSLRIFNRTALNKLSPQPDPPGKR